MHDEKVETLPNDDFDSGTTAGKFPIFKALMAESVRLEHVMKTAKTSLKRDFYKKKLAKNNAKVLKWANVMDIIQRAKAEKKQVENAE